MDRQDLELVCSIQRHGSLTGAAKALGVATPAISKRLAALEDRLQHPLFVRTTRVVTPTTEGELLCERAHGLLQQFELLEAELQERRDHPAGTIKLAASLGFGRLWVGPAVAEFQSRHTEVRVEVTLTEQLPDLERDGFDGAIWLWSPREQKASGWITRRLARNQRILVASPHYLRHYGTPDTPEDLAQHNCLTIQENMGQGRHAADAWVLTRTRDKQPTRVHIKGNLSSNSGELVRDWCLSGQGIMLRSLWDIGPQIASGQLVQVLPAYTMPDADVHWLMPYRQRTPKRVRLLIDFLVGKFQAQPWLTRNR